MFKRHEYLLNRYNSLEWAQLGNEIAKYSPKKYDSSGVYIKEEWTSFSDINHVFDGRIFSFEDYCTMENNYINASIALAQKSGVTYLTVGYIEKNQYTALPFEHQIKECMDLEDSFSRWHVGSRVAIQGPSMVKLLKLCLREKMWCILVNLSLDFELSFGYDYYMIIHSTMPLTEVNEIVEKNHLYLNPRAEQI